MRIVASVRRTSREFAVDTLTQQLMRRIAEGLKAEAIKPAIALTSGTISAAQMAEAGHPFARRSRDRTGRLKRGRTAEIRAVRRAIGRLPRLPINRQSGELQKSLKVTVRSGGGVWRLYLDTNSPHAIVLSPQGTKTMVPRGFVEELQRRMNSQAMVSRLRGIIRRTRLR